MNRIGRRLIVAHYNCKDECSMQCVHTQPLIDTCPLYGLPASLPAQDMEVIKAARRCHGARV